MKNKKLLIIWGKNYEAPVLAGICAIVILFLFFYYHRLSPFIYATNDDLFFKTIVSGEVTGSPEPRLWYIGYPAGLLIASLYRLFPAMPWYGLFLCFSFGLTMFVVLYRMLKPEKSWPVRLVTLALFLLFSYAFLFLHIAELQFTTVTGMVGAGALFLFVLADPADPLPETLKNYGGFYLLSACALSIRDKGFFMLLPFVGMLGIGKCISLGKSVRRKNLFAAGLLFLGLLAVIFLINKAAYGRDDWKIYSDYSKSSDTIYDYTGYPDYDEYAEVYHELGLTRSSYEAASHHYNVLLEPNINKQTMNTLEEIASVSLSTSFSGLPGKIREMAAFFLDRHLSYTDRPLNLLVYCCYLLFFLCALFAGKKSALRDIIFTGIARMVIWIYLIYYGRLPSRVSQAVYLAELAILLAIAFKNKLWGRENPDALTSRRTKFCRALWMAGICFLTVIAIRFGFPKARAAASEAQSRLRFSQAFVELKAYFSAHPDAFYYLDMNSFGSFTEDALEYGENQYGNYIFMGSWVTHSPWYTAKFERQQIPEEKAAAALYDNPNVYAVFMDTPETGYEYLQDFYAENYPGVSLETLDTVNTSNDITFFILKGYEQDETH